MLTLKSSHQCHNRETTVETKLKEQEYEIPEYDSEGNAGVSTDDEDVITTVDTVSTFLVGSFSRFGKNFILKYVI